jgi:hypothetical protein
VTGNGPQVMATLRNLAIAVLKLGGASNIAAACRRHARDATRTPDHPGTQPGMTTTNTRLCRGGHRRELAAYAGAGSHACLQVPAGLVGLRRPRQRRLPAPVLLDENRPAPDGQRHLVSRRPLPDRLCPSMSGPPMVTSEFVGLTLSHPVSWLQYFLSPSDSLDSGAAVPEDLDPR